MSYLSIDEKACRLMTKQWMTAREIWQLVDEGAYSTCRDGVVRLWKAGRIQRTKDRPWRYRRVIMVG